MEPIFNPTNNSTKVPSTSKSEIELLIESGDRAAIQSYYQEVLDKSKVFFDEYAGKKRPSFEFTNDPNVKTAYFEVDENGNNPQVKISLDYFLGKFSGFSLSNSQVRHEAFHELTHFTDYAENRIEYMDQFERSKVMGEDMAKHIAKYREEKGKGMDESKIKALAEKLTSIYISLYYNNINDIFVDNNVAHKVKEYSKDGLGVEGSGHEEIRRLKKDFIYKGSDLSAYPEFYQFMFFLLRGDGIVDEGMRITEDVQAALSKVYEVNYKRFDKRRNFLVPVKIEVNAEDIINIFLNPNKLDDILEMDISSESYKANINSPYKAKKDTSLKYRTKYINETLLPTFNDLLFNDMKDKLDFMSIEDLLKLLMQILKEAEQNSPDFIPDEVRDEYRKWKQADDKKDEVEAAKKAVIVKDGKPKNGKAEIGNSEGMNEPKQIPETPEQIKAREIEEAKEVKHKTVDDFTRENNIDADIARRIKEAWDDVSNSIDSLTRVWMRIVSGKGNEVDIKRGGEYVSGADVNIENFINQYPDFLTGHGDKLKPFVRNEHIETPTDRPNRIEISIILDQSPSMGDKNSTKNKVLDRVITMLNMSLDKFNQILYRNREATKSLLHVDREIILFGSIAKNILPFNVRSIEDASRNRGKANYESLKEVGAKSVGGSTNDAAAFEKVNESMSKEKENNLANGKLLKIVIEVTDGIPNPNAIPKIKKYIAEMKKKGIILIGLQIGEVDEGSRKIFESIWNVDEKGQALPNDHKNCYVVGTNFLSLPEIIAKRLESILGEIKIYD